METTTYTPEQQAENRRKWAAALRSGEYEQRRHCLAGNGGFCCLGVAGVVLGHTPTAEFDMEIYKLVDASMGIKDQMDFFHANDSRGLTFPQIADLIESDPTLFTTPEGASK